MLSNSNGSTSNHTDSKPVTKKSIIRRGQEVQLTSSSAPGMCSSSMTEVFETEPLHNNDNQFRQVKLEKDSTFLVTTQSTYRFMKLDILKASLENREFWILTLKKVCKKCKVLVCYKFRIFNKLFSWKSNQKQIWFSSQFQTDFYYIQIIHLCNMV